MLEQLREWLVLDPNSPSGLAWAKDKKGGAWVKKGAPAMACLSKLGYYVGKLNGRVIRAHRAVFALHNGYLPAEVDHLDGNPQNNAPDNLRAVSKTENQHNRRSAKGYSFHKRHCKWVASITLAGVTHHLGYFATEAEARTAYLEAKKVYHPTAPINKEGA